jgi:hypothetical protein
MALPGRLPARWAAIDRMLENRVTETPPTFCSRNRETEAASQFPELA